MSAADTPAVASALDIDSIRAALAAEQIDAWLLYDFHGLNPIAANVARVARPGGHLSTRRWFYLIPVDGEPRGLVHAIEADTLAQLPGRIERYARREELEKGLERLLTGIHRVAMEYSPECAIPYVSRVDAGTVELVRRSGAEVVSSANLVQRFSAVWDDEQIRTHLEASERLHRVKDRAFDEIAERIRQGSPATEFDIQQLMIGWYAEERLVSDSPPNVSTGSNTGNPHYLPTRETARSIGPESLVLIDLWAKLEIPGAVFADITWMGYTGAHAPERFSRTFRIVCEARDAAVRLVQTAVRTGRDVRGWEVDRAAASVLEEAGLRDRILHRTGHSLGTEVHGTGVNMDDYETHDDRSLLPGTGLTIEPGLYFSDFGVRSEINMIVGRNDATVSGPLQHDILMLD
jgi:Xaa-Pro aminopeptidase